MKYIFALFLVSNIGFASGKIQLKPAYFQKAQGIGMQVGISVYERLAGRLHYNQWTGLGHQPRKHEADVLYFVSEHALEYQMNRWMIGAGYAFKRVNQKDQDLFSDNSVFAKISYKLW